MALDETQIATLYDLIGSSAPFALVCAFVTTTVERSQPLTKSTGDEAAVALSPTIPLRGNARAA
jgi:hypothetical protein